jgi:inhibitor of cysteine peptidase
MPLATFVRGVLTAAVALGALALIPRLAAAEPVPQGAHAGSFCGPMPASPTPSPTSTLIQAHAGQPFAITLDSNPSTGYSWALATALDPNVVELLHHNYQRASTGGIGSGGTEIWTFEPLCEGFTTIVLKYQRPWESDQPPARQVAYDIFIQQ